MIYEAVENILQKKQDPDAEKALSKHSCVIEEYVNFGTHILDWDIKKMNGGDDVLVPLLFLRNSIELADAISVLIKSSTVDAAKPVLRSLLENTLGLEYLLEKDTDKRSLSYIVWNTHEELKVLEKFDNTSEVGKQLTAELKKDKLIGHNDNSKHLNKPIYAWKRQNNESLLKLPLYAPIEEEYQNTLKRLDKKKPSWFTLFGGPTNIVELAKYLKHHVLYEFFYRFFSGDVHGNNNVKGKLFPHYDGSVNILPLRDSSQAHFIAQHTHTLLLNSYLSYFKRRLPENQKEFGEWYMKVRELHPEVMNNL